MTTFQPIIVPTVYQFAHVCGFFIFIFVYHRHGYVIVREQMRRKIKM